MKPTIKEISNTLLEKNIRPSHQRIKILEYLLENRIHPTVDMIYSELHEDIPTLSKTTVYNTLSLFIDANLVKSISIEDHEARYDIESNEHGHFKCTKCNEIYDLSIDTNGLIEDKLNNFKIDEMNIYLKGLCPKCSNDNN
jgi:Fe2+ or Zn2+ uptake regulation protein